MRQGEPIWPAEISAAVEQRLIKCKAALIDYIADQILTGRPPPTTRDQEEGQKKLEQYLRLDDGILSLLHPDQAEQALRIGAEAEADIELLMTGEQHREFREVGFRTLLGRVDYPGDAELVRRLNRISSDAPREDYRNLFCPKPFEHAEIGQGGKTCVCCPLMLPTPVGDCRTGSFMDVWNSPTAQTIRASILDGSFTYCIEQHCPDLQNKTLPKRDQLQDPVHRDIVANNRTELETGPKTLVMGYDKSCNLACPSCRVEAIMVTEGAKRSAEKVQDWATAEHLKDARRLDITLSGDALGSPVYHKFLRNFDPTPYPDLRITLCTNGLLLTEQTWSRICNEIIDFVYISVDATTPETYAVNRGGDFNRLNENLRFVGGLRSSGQLETFALSFVVQENNYREMPAFVSLGQSVHADKVIFIRLANVGTFTQEEYDRRAVHDPSHPNHSDFLEVLKDPLLGLPCVELESIGNLAGLRDVQADLPSEAH